MKSATGSTLPGRKGLFQSVVWSLVARYGSRLALIAGVAMSVCCCRGEASEDAKTQAVGGGAGAPAAAIRATDDTVTIDGTSWTPCAAEYERCTFTGSKRVLYGTAEHHAIKTFSNGTGCDNGVFDDPAPGASKHCWVEASANRAAPAIDKPPPSSPLAMSCGAPSAAVGAAASGDPVEADTPGSDGTRMFALGKPFELALTTRAHAGDTLSWQIRDA